MNPLVITRSLCKQINLLLGNDDPIAHRDLLANAGRQIIKILKNFHMLALLALSIGRTS